MENWSTKNIYLNSLLLHCQVCVIECSISIFHLSVPDPETDSAVVVLSVQHHCLRVSEFCVQIELACWRPSAECVCVCVCVYVCVCVCVCVCVLQIELS